MSLTDDPFAILGISPSAGAAAVEAAFRALARQYHPDVAGPASTERMQSINWARTELARDLDDWRLRAEEAHRARAVTRRTTLAASPNISGEWVSTVLLDWVEVQPQVLILSGLAGVGAVFRARAAGTQSQQVRARIRKDSFVDVIRGTEDSDVVTFSVRILYAPQFTNEDAIVVPIEVVAPDHSPNHVFVSVQPMTPKVVAQTQLDGRVAPPRHASASARIHFGQHRGRTYADIALENPGYLQWMIANNIQGYIAVECARLALGHLPQRMAGSTQGTAHQIRGKGPSSELSTARMTSRAPAPLPPSEPPPPSSVPHPSRPKGLGGFIKGLLGGPK